MVYHRDPLVIFDAGWLSHRTLHGGPSLSFQGSSTGVIFGFLEALRTVCCDTRINSNRVAVCFDSRSSLRRDVFPGYKAKRAENRTDEEWKQILDMKRQLDLLRRRILPAIGFPCYRQAGLESDDLMAMLANEVDAANGRAVLVTSDGDLYQCITLSTVHWFDPSRDSYLDAGRFWAKKGVQPCDWAMVKAIGGCGTDCVPGVGGVGEKTAIDHVLGMQIKNQARKQAIACAAGQKIIKRNLRLVRLPHAATRAVPIREPAYDPKAFDAVAKEYGFASYLDGPRRAEWAAFFAGSFGATGLQVARVRTRSRGEVSK